MSDIVLNDYYSAGYFLIRSSKRPFWLNEPIGLIPDTILSLESEFCDKFSVSWVWDDDDHDLAVKFGIDESKLPELRQWCSEHHRQDIDVWSMFYSTESIRSFVEQFLSEERRDDLYLIGAGLHHSCLEDWLDNDENLEGVEKRILEKLPMESGGDILGFDVASYAHHNFDHTWLSHLHYRGVFQELGIRPCKYGLLQTREDAIVARDYTDEHDIYAYEYWLLVDYPLINWLK